MRKKNKFLKSFTLTLSIIDLLVIVGLVLWYGVLKENIIVSNMDGKLSYLVYALYSEEDINKVVAKRMDTTDRDEEIEQVSSEEVVNNDALEILKKDKDNLQYKYINIKVGGYPAYLVAIYDPSMVGLITSAKFNTGNSQETVLNMCKREGARVCINGGMFVDYGTGSDIPIGYLIKDSKIVWADNKSKKANLIGFTNDNKLLLVNATGDEAISMGMRDALEFGPFLIKDGEVVPGADTSVGGYYGAARVAIAQRSDGIVLFLVSDGTHGNGASMKDIIATFQKYGAYNAANLDGGASSQLVVEGKLVNKPINILGEQIYGGRRVVSGFGLMKE